MNDISVTVTIDGGCAISPSMIEELDQAARHVETSPGLQVMVLQLKGSPSDKADTLTSSVRLVAKWEKVLRRIERLDVPVLATATGLCGGTALDAFFVADLRIADPSFRLSFLSCNGNIWPGMVLFRLANQVNANAARKAALFGKELTSAEAEKLGLVEIVENSAEALQGVLEVLLLSPAQKDYGIRRQLLLDASSSSHEEALERHLAACDRLFRHSSRQPSHNA